MEGWFKIHRKITQWDWADSPKHVNVFLHLLARCNYKKSSWRGKEILPGQILTGRKQISKWAGVSEQSVRTVLNDLKSTSNLTIKSYPKYSIITITNWESYQGTNQQTNQQVTSNQPASNHIQEYKKDKNIRNNKRHQNTLTDLLQDDDLRNWVSTITPRTAQKITDKYRKDFLLKEIDKAYTWDQDQAKSKKNIGSFLSAWLDRSREPDKLNHDPLDEFFAQYEGGNG